MWGLLNGIILMLATEIAPACEKLHARHPGLSKNKAFIVLQCVRTVGITAALRMLDLNTSVGVTFARLGSIFTGGNYSIFADGSIFNLGLGGADYIIVAIGCVAMLAVSLLAGKKKVSLRLEEKGYGAVYAAIAVLICVTLIFGAYGIGYDSSQFIYNQF